MDAQMYTSSYTDSCTHMPIQKQLCMQAHKMHMNLQAQDTYTHKHADPSSQHPFKFNLDEIVTNVYQGKLNSLQVNADVENIPRQSFEANKASDYRPFAIAFCNIS